MINARDAGIRQADCFLRVAQVAQELYAKGSGVAVDFFDAEAENIRAAEDWVAGHTVDNDKSRAVSNAFSTLGERLVGLRLNPRKPPSEQEAEENVRAALEKFDKAFPQIKLAQKWVMENAASDAEVARMCSLYASTTWDLLELRLSRPERIEWTEAALAAARLLQDRQSEAAHLRNLGLAHNSLGERRRAVYYFRQSIAVARAVDDRRAEAIALGNLGAACQESGHPSRAMTLYEKGIDIARDIGDRFIESKALGGLALAYADKGQTVRALEYYEQQIALTRQIGDYRGEGIALYRTGVFFCTLRHLSRALEYYMRSLEIARRFGDKQAECYILGSLADAYVELKDKDQARDLYGQQLELARKIGDQRSERSAQLGMTDTCY